MALGFVPEHPDDFLVKCESRGVRPIDLIEKTNLTFLIKIAFEQGITLCAPVRLWLKALLSRGVELDLNDFSKINFRLWSRLLSVPGWLEGYDEQGQRFSGLEALLETRKACCTRKGTETLRKPTMRKWLNVLPQLVHASIENGVAGTKVLGLPDKPPGRASEEEIQFVKEFLRENKTWAEIIRMDTSSSVFTTSLVEKIWGSVTRYRIPRRTAVDASLRKRKGWPLDLSGLIIEFCGYKAGKEVKTI